MGSAGKGGVWRGRDWHGPARLGFSSAQRGTAGFGAAWRGWDGLGLDGLGRARLGSFLLNKEARLGWARLELAWIGWAWQWWVWCGVAWQGLGFLPDRSKRQGSDRLGVAGHGPERLGLGVFSRTKWQGPASMGSAWHGEEWRGEVPFSLGGDAMSGDAVEVLIGTLVKGDVLTAEQCVKLLGMRIEDPRYSLALLGLCKRIEDTLGELGRPCVVRCEAGGIHVMEDAEAAIYVQQRFQSHQAGLGRSHKRALVIDQGQLSAEQRAEHERNVAMMAFKIQAIRRAGRSKLTLAGGASD